MHKKKTSADKPRSESAPEPPESDETVVEFVFGLGEDTPTTPTPKDGALLPDANGKKSKKRSVTFKFTNNPG